MNVKFLLTSLAAASAPLSTYAATLIFSQYAEDGDIKGVEIWNSSASAINLSESNVLTVANFNNGSTTATYTFSLNTGTIAAGDVLVLADGSNNSIWADSGISFLEANFSFNGDDALELRLDGVLLDMIGVVGSDPGSSWTGSGVDTRDQNIALNAGITTGDTDGFTDPSSRFTTIAQNPLDSASGTNLSGFGVAPVPEPGTFALFAGMLTLTSVMLRRRR